MCYTKCWYSCNSYRIDYIRKPLSGLHHSLDILKTIEAIECESIGLEWMYTGNILSQ